MNRLAHVVIPFALAVHAFALAGGQAPAINVVDEQKTIGLLTSAPADCVSIPKGHYSIVLSQERLKQFPTRSGWKTEEERLALIAGNRARALIALEGAATDSLGCRVISQAIPNDSEYLLLSELQSGAAAVVDMNSGAFLDHLDARTTGFHCGGNCGGRGDTVLRVPADGFVILMLNMWIS